MRKITLLLIAFISLCQISRSEVYIGDFSEGDVVEFIWSSGESRTTPGQIKVMKDASAVNSTVGVFDSSALGGYSGLNAFSLDTSEDAAFYTKNHNYTVVVTDAVVGGSTVTLVAGSFSIDNRATAGLVWDEELTGAAHNITASSGRRLRGVSDIVRFSGVIVSATSNTVTLDTNAPVSAGSLDGSEIQITLDGEAQGQTGLILDYLPGRVVILEKDWKFIPDPGASYQVIARSGRGSTNEGAAMSATTNTITLNSYASLVDEIYDGQTIILTSGQGQDQSRIISSYSNGVATVDRAWDVEPAYLTGYRINPTAAGVTRDQVQEAIVMLDEIQGPGFTPGQDSLASIRSRGDAAWVTGGVGSGSEVSTYTLTTGPPFFIPVPQVQVRVALESDPGGNVATAYTSDFGQAVFLLDPGTYVLWRKKSGVNFGQNPIDWKVD